MYKEEVVNVSYEGICVNFRFQFLRSKSFIVSMGFNLHHLIKNKQQICTFTKRGQSIKDQKNKKQMHLEY